MIFHRKNLRIRKLDGGCRVAEDLKIQLMKNSEDHERGEWHLLMPNCVRESLATSYPAYWDMPMKGMKAPSAKVLRIMAAFQRYMSGEDE